MFRAVGANVIFRRAGIRVHSDGKATFQCEAVRNANDRFHSAENHVRRHEFFDSELRIRLLATKHLGIPMPARKITLIQVININDQEFSSWNNEGACRVDNATTDSSTAATAVCDLGLQ
jgi:hypothetical protein